MRTRAKKFCDCIKKVAPTVKPRRGTTNEGSAIAICTTRLLWPHGKTLKSVSCKKKMLLKTQRRKHNK
jgi:hypothetical protein